MSERAELQDESSPARPTEVGGHEILEEIARGGMGVVYKARERDSGRLVALKMMLSDRADGGGLRRFELEARATSELNHPGIVAIHAWGEHQGTPFYTMDFVPGVGLHQLLEKGPLEADRAVRYWLGIARAVAAAHTLGIVHRDLKPSNIIIDLADQPRVLDFGLAKRHRSEVDLVEKAVPEVLPNSEMQAAMSGPIVASASTPRDDRSGRGLTEVGAILGTPAYMAPEQVRADQEKVGPAADVHALGAMFFEMIAGRPPFQASSTYETLLQVLKEPAAALVMFSRTPHGHSPRSVAIASRKSL